MPSGEAEPLSKHQFQADSDETADNGQDGQIRLSELNSRVRQHYSLKTGVFTHYYYRY